MPEISLEDYKRAYREMEKEEGKKSFFVHLIVYCLVNAVLITLDFAVVPGPTWFFWPLFGWGIGLLFHYLFALRWIEGELRKKEAIAEARAGEAKK